MRPSPRYHKQASRKRPSAKAFTLVELLVVVLILAILMAVALPLYLSAISNSARRTARGNMHTLINAEQVYRLKKNHYTGTLANLVTNDVIDRLPAGPGNTKYDLYLGVNPDLPSDEQSNSNLPDGRTVPPGSVAACAADTQLGPSGDYGCFIPGQDNE